MQNLLRLSYEKILLLASVNLRDDYRVTFSVPVTPHTFRHSYAMHMLYAGIPLKVLQSLMGHKSISSTEVYTKVFALDVAARHRVQFAMPEAEAVALIKKLTPNQST